MEGNIDEAQSRLLAVGETPGPSHLNSSGLDVTLAWELLEWGESESDVVIKHLSLRSESWEVHRAKLERRTTQIKNGGTPGIRSDFRS